MFPTIDPAELADCVVPLDEEGRRALRRYWERVIREEWVSPRQRTTPSPRPSEDGQRRLRGARRAVAHTATTGTAVVTLQSAARRAGSSTTGEAA